MYAEGVGLGIASVATALCTVETEEMAASIATRELFFAVEELSALHARGVVSSGRWSSDRRNSSCRSSGRRSSGLKRSNCRSSGLGKVAARFSGPWSSGPWSSGPWSSGRWSSGSWSSGLWSSGRWSSGVGEG